MPPFIATLGMMMLLKGLSLVISGTKPIYFNWTRRTFRRDLAGLADRLPSCPSLPMPNCGADPLRAVAIVASMAAQPDDSSAATPSRSAATRRRRGSRACGHRLLEDRWSTR
jgi:hypothetical protein